MQKIYKFCVILGCDVVQEKYLISINLIGTLLNNEEKISDYTKKVLNNCKNKRSKIIINTSQNYIKTLKVINEINIDYLSCFSGNYIASKNKIYRENYLSLFISNEIMKFFKLPSGAREILLFTDDDDKKSEIEETIDKDERWTF